jgi:plasmid replication initiation protein
MREADRTLPSFRAIPGTLAVRDCQDLMAYPFFSLAKTKRIAPIHYATKGIEICVEGTLQHGIATIWDADILIWATSQWVEARDSGIPTSRRVAVTPYEILRFAGRGTAASDYQRFRAALDRLQSTTIQTSIRQEGNRRQHRFSWVNEWQERLQDNRPQGLELVLPDWFYDGVLRSGQVLTIDRRYFHLTGGLQRWLYRLVRKHAGRQPSGWRFEFAHLYAKSGVLIRFSDFAIHLRQIALSQSLPGYQLRVERRKSGTEILAFQPSVSAQVRERIALLSEQLRVGGKL